MAITWAKIAFEDDVVTKALFDAQTILQATGDDTPAALTVTEQTVVGRITGGNIVALSVAQLQTLVFSAILPEDTTMLFDVVLSADGKYSGIGFQGTAGAAIAYGEVCYLSSADSKWELAQGDAEATVKPWTAVCVVAAAEDATATFLFLGKIREDDWNFTAGAPIFIDPDTPGALSETELTTGEFQKCVAWGGMTANEIMVVPNPDWVKVA